jgi:rare lipoprotein A (peptidoglycan hydrolase)
VELLIEEIEEYVCGFQFFYVRYKATGKTESFDRNNIVAAYRKLPTGDFRPIHLKKVKTYEGFED